jgi:hypothetical protein
MTPLLTAFGIKKEKTKTKNFWPKILETHKMKTTTLNTVYTFCFLQFTAFSPRNHYNVLFSLQNLHQKNKNKKKTLKINTTNRLWKTPVLSYVSFKDPTFWDRLLTTLWNVWSDNRIASYIAKYPVKTSSQK